jgi:hypothetical protein
MQGLRRILLSMLQFAESVSGSDIPTVVDAHSAGVIGTLILLEGGVEKDKVQPFTWRSLAQERLIST